MLRRLQPPIGEAPLRLANSRAIFRSPLRKTRERTGKVRQSSKIGPKMADA
jgi:hypothetical protein